MNIIVYEFIWSHLIISACLGGLERFSLHRNCNKFLFSIIFVLFIFLFMVGSGSSKNNDRTPEGRNQFRTFHRTKCHKWKSYNNLSSRTPRQCYLPGGSSCSAQWMLCEEGGMCVCGIHLQLELINYCGYRQWRGGPPTSTAEPPARSRSC